MKLATIGAPYCTEVAFEEQWLDIMIEKSDNYYCETGFRLILV